MKTARRAPRLTTRFCQGGGARWCCGVTRQCRRRRGWQSKTVRDGFGFEKDPLEVFQEVERVRGKSWGLCEVGYAQAREVWLWLTRPYASEPKRQRLCFQVTEEWILRFEPLSGRTSKGIPGFTRGFYQFGTIVDGEERGKNLRDIEHRENNAYVNVKRVRPRVPKNRVVITDSHLFATFQLIVSPHCSTRCVSLHCPTRCVSLCHFSTHRLCRHLSTASHLAASTCDHINIIIRLCTRNNTFYTLWRTFSSVLSALTNTLRLSCLLALPGVTLLIPSLGETTGYWQVSHLDSKPD